MTNAQNRFADALQRVLPRTVTSYSNLVVEVPPHARGFSWWNQVAKVRELVRPAHTGILQDARGRPSSQPCRFAANGAWLAVQVMAHNLARWTARIGLGEQVVTTKTLRRRFFSLTGRLTRSARRLTLHLPQRWPWENQSSGALARLRALPFPGLTAATSPLTPIRPTDRSRQLAPTQPVKGTPCPLPIELCPP